MGRYKWSFWGLAVTAAFQVWISMISGSIALLADTIHNVGDALTAIPLWFAFMLAQAGQIALNLFVDVDNPMVLDALNKAYGLGTEIGVILPFSRKHELEADRIGVGLMDKAGYNPNGAIEFWKRMKQGRKGEQPLVYLSTHPVDDKRITEIEKILQNQKKQR